MIRIGHLSFDQVDYDAKGDVLYLHVGASRDAADADETPEGHVVRYDEQGDVTGLTIVNARWLLERDGGVTITLPRPQLRASASDLADAVGLAS
jgi:uncharacterized protein YuzE